MYQEPYTPNQGDPYGGNPPYDTPFATPERKQSKSFSTAALVLGILAIVCCCFSELSLILSALAIVFAVLGRRRLSAFDGMCTAGLICGIIGAAMAAYSIISGILNPVDEAELEAYIKMLEEMLKELESAKGSEGTAVFRFLK